MASQSGTVIAVSLTKPGVFTSLDSRRMTCPTASSTAISHVSRNVAAMDLTACSASSGTAGLPPLQMEASSSISAGSRAACVASRRSASRCQPGLSADHPRILVSASLPSSYVFAFRFAPAGCTDSLYVPVDGLGQRFAGLPPVKVADALGSGMTWSGKSFKAQATVGSVMACSISAAFMGGSASCTLPRVDDSHTGRFIGRGVA